MSHWLLLGESYTTFLCSSFRWLHLECERQNSGQAEIHPREDYICSSCRSPAAEQTEDMDTSPELNPQSAAMHTDAETDLQPAKKHTDLEFGTKLPPKMHNDPKSQLLAVPLHSDPGPVQATVQEEKLDASAARPGGLLFQSSKSISVCGDLIFTRVPPYSYTSIIMFYNVCF